MYVTEKCVIHVADALSSVANSNTKLRLNNEKEEKPHNLICIVPYIDKSAGYCRLTDGHTIDNKMYHAVNIKEIKGKGIGGHQKHI